MTLSLGDERGLEVRIRGRLPVAGGPRELEGPFDVLTGAPASRAGGGSSGNASRECRRGASRKRAPSAPRARAPWTAERRRSRCSTACSGQTPSRKSTAARSTSENAGALGELARAGEQRSSASLDAPSLDQRPRLAEQRTRSSRSGAPVPSSAARPRRRTPRAPRVYSLRLGERLGAGERSLDAAALLGADAALEVVRIDAEPVGEPLEGLAVGRVLPRSIWLTYSFEKRPPASSLWVRPAATRPRSVVSRSDRCRLSAVCRALGALRGHGEARVARNYFI